MHCILSLLIAMRNRPKCKYVCYVTQQFTVEFLYRSYSEAVKNNSFDAEIQNEIQNEFKILDVDV